MFSATPPRPPAPRWSHTLRSLAARLPFRLHLLLSSALVTLAALQLAIMALLLAHYADDRAGTSRTMAVLGAGLAQNLAASSAQGGAGAARQMAMAALKVEGMRWIALSGPGLDMVLTRPGAHAPSPAALAHAPAPLSWRQWLGGMGTSHFAIVHNGRQLGTLAIGYQYPSLWALLRHSLVPALAVMALVLVIKLVVGLGLWRFWFRPFEAMREAMEAVHLSGDLSARLPPPADRDFAPLVAGFNAMMAQLEAHNRQRRRAMAALAQARDVAERASQAKSEFLANMSHELRTPLSAILGYAEMLEAELASAGLAQARTDAGWIITSARQLLEMINGLLDLAKIEAGQATLDLHPFNPGGLMQEVEGLLQPLAARHGNRLSVQVAPELGTINADATKLRQCLLNLGSNAAKFTHDGFIELRADVQEQALVFTVADTGIGMAPEALERIFQPFVQSDSSITRRYGGTGLGLAIVERFAALMGGTIAVTSEPGYGSVFTLRLPREAPAQAPPPELAPPALPSPGLPHAA